MLVYRDDDHTEDHPTLATAPSSSLWPVSGVKKDDDAV
jgi:hypothetical protein